MFGTDFWYGNTLNEMCDCGCNLVTHEELGMCLDCYRYTCFQEDLFESVRNLAVKKGTELGIERAVRDTIYQEPEDAYYILDSIDIPEHVRFNKLEYTRVFQDAQYDTYLKVYNIHKPLIQQLQQRYSTQLLFSHFIHHYKNSGLLELELFRKIKSFI